MERKGFTMKIKPGVLEEYKRRHDEIWPEMSDVLTKAGLKNYSIWIATRTLPDGSKEPIKDFVDRVFLHV